MEGGIADATNFSVLALATPGYSDWDARSGVPSTRARHS